MFNASLIGKHVAEVVDELQNSLKECHVNNLRVLVSTRQRIGCRIQATANVSVTRYPNVECGPRSFD